MNSRDPSPHHALNNPARDPDPTEWPDPYERRLDPREPSDPADDPSGEDTHPPTGSISTSEPHPDLDPQAKPAEKPKHDKLDR